MGVLGIAGKIQAAFLKNDRAFKLFAADGEAVDADCWRGDSAPEF
jgi:hypothetical protein